MPEVMLWDPFERMFWGMGFVIAALASILYLINGKKKENRNEKLINFSFSIVLISLLLMQIFWFIGELQIKGFAIDNIFYIDYDNPDEYRWNVNDSYLFYLKVAYISYNIGSIFFIYIYEKIQNRRIYILTMIETIILVGFVITRYDLLLIYILYVLFPMSSLCYFTVLFNYTRWPEIELKLAAAMIITGSSLVTYSALIRDLNFKQYNSIPLFYSPLIWLIGVIFCILPVIVNPKYFPKLFNFWFGYGIILMIILFFFSFIYISIIGLEAIYIVLPIILFFIFNLLYTLKTNKTQEKTGIEPTSVKFGGIFTRPKKITEEEVYISKEKKICLVCKGKVRNFGVFICDCGAFYCDKCARALIGIENQCWACGSALDESKPVRLPEKREKGVEVEKKIHKKGKGLR